METITTTLGTQWDQLKQENPRLRIRNAAAQLNVSEAELLATRVGRNVTALKPEFVNILKEIEPMGKVMALTRNDAVVHERQGVYSNPSLSNPHVGLFVNPDIDLRIFFQSWAHAFAVKEMARGKERMSIQFFAKDGEAVHKIYMTADSDVNAYDALVEKYRSEAQLAELQIEEKKAPESELPDSNIDTAGFQQEWRDLKDTHDFYGLLRKYKLTRTQALRLAPEGNYAVKVNPTAFRDTVTMAAKQECPIMVFVGNRGMIQIHTGPVKKLLDHEEWFNVMDPDFNLHVRENAISDCWVVRKPTEDGMVTALECFDSKGTQIVQLFGKRKPGIPELPEWQDIIAWIEAKHKL